jgi:hypothetical protein
VAAYSDYTSGNSFNIHGHLMVYFAFYTKNFGSDRYNEASYTSVGDTLSAQYDGITTYGIGKKIIYLIGNLNETGTHTDQTNDLSWGGDYLTRHKIT